MVQLSIIIPYYNYAQYLETLLESIPGRDDIQVIVVDDNSDLFITEYKKIISEHPDLLFLRNSTGNKGAGACRNIGLENAVGKWILFADSDDLFTADFYNLVQEYFDSSYEVIFFRPTSKYLGTNRHSYRNIEYNNIISNFQNYPNKKTELQLRYNIPSPCSKLIQKKFIDCHQISFEEIIASNDRLFSTKIGHLMESFYISDQVIYWVTQHPESLTSNRTEPYFDSRFKAAIRNFEYLNEFLSIRELQMLDYPYEKFIWQSSRFGFQKMRKVIQQCRKSGIIMRFGKYFNPFYIIPRINIKLRKLITSANVYQSKDI